MSSRMTRALAVALAVSLALATGADASRSTALKGSVLPGLAKAKDLGHYRTAPGYTMVVAVTMHHDLAALYRAEHALYDPSSPSYHHFYTPAAWRARFGTPPDRLSAVRSYVTRDGLRLVRPDLYGDYVMASGSVAQVERTFGVQIDRFRQGRQTFFANKNAAHVPAGLGIDAVLGLEGRDAFHLAGPMVRTSPQTQGGCVPGPTCVGAMEPQDLWSAYNMPSDDIGQGQTIAIIGAGRTGDVIQALREFEDTRKPAAFPNGLPHVPVQVVHTDPGDASVPESQRDDSGRIEWELDSQSSTGMAPGVSQLRMYFGSSLQLTQLTGSIAYWVNDNQGPLQASASLGICEDDPALDPFIGADQRADMALLAQAGAEGRTLFASTGDTGSSCPVPFSIVPSLNGITYGEIPSDEYPSVDPNAVAVGGTALYTTGGDNPQIASERAWDHTGGGPSKFIEQPDYQTGASPLLASNFCISQADGTPDAPGTLCRGNADVAAISGDFTESVDHRLPGALPLDGGNGYDIVDVCPADAQGTGPNTVGPVVSPEQACTYGMDPGTTNDHFSEGGTSLSSPLWLGMWARVQAHHDAIDPTTLRTDTANSLGFANDVIYKVAQAAGSKDFNDVTAGNNPLPAGPGWDFPTGWGSPNLTNLVADATGDGKTAAIAPMSQAPTDPPEIFATQPTGGPSCNYAFVDPPDDSADEFTLKSNPALDLIEGDYGLTPDGSALRVVMTLEDLSKDIVAGADFNDYELYWNYTAPGQTDPTTYAVDVLVDSSGNVTYTDGTMQTQDVGGAFTNFSFVANPDSHATGTFGSGPDGKIEIDVPLADIGNPKAGEILTQTNAFTADGSQEAGQGFIADQAGPGGDYHVGEPTCIDSGIRTSGSTGGGDNGSSGGGDGSGSNGSGDQGGGGDQSQPSGNAPPSQGTSGSGAVLGQKVASKPTARRRKKRHHRRHRHHHTATRRSTHR